VFLISPSVGFLWRQPGFFYLQGLFLSAPVTHGHVGCEEIYLPPGEWYDFWTNAKLSSKEKLLCSLASMRCRSTCVLRAIVPMQPLVQSQEESRTDRRTARISAQQQRELRLRGPSTRTMHTYAYQKGEICALNYSCQVSSGAVDALKYTEKSGVSTMVELCKTTIYGALTSPKEVRSESKSYTSGATTTLHTRHSHHADLEGVEVRPRVLSKRPFWLSLEKKSRSMRRIVISQFALNNSAFASPKRIPWLPPLVPACRLARCEVPAADRRY